jgi:hypothetical protein
LIYGCFTHTTNCITVNCGLSCIRGVYSNVQLIQIMCKLLLSDIYKIQRLTVCVNHEDSIAYHHPLPSLKQNGFALDKTINILPFTAQFYHIAYNYSTVYSKRFHTQFMCKLL